MRRPTPDRPRAARARTVPNRRAGRAGSADASSLPGAVAAPMPAAVAAQLAVLADAPPPGAGWVHEVKFDGYRLLAHVRDGDVRLVTRRGNDWTAKFPTIARALR